MSLRLVIVLTAPLKTNRTRNGPVPQFAITETQFEMITDILADNFIKKILPKIYKAIQKEKMFERYVEYAAIQVGRSLGIKSNWGQKRPFFLPFNVPVNKTFTPIIVYNKSGRAETVVGVSNTGKTISLVNANLKYPFSGTGFTIPQGTVHNGLQNGIPELVIPASTLFNSKSETKYLGDHLKKKIKIKSGVNINQLIRSK